MLPQIFLKTIFLACYNTGRLRVVSGGFFFAFFVFFYKEYKTETIKKTALHRQKTDPLYAILSHFILGVKVFVPVKMGIKKRPDHRGRGLKGGNHLKIVFWKMLPFCYQF